MKEIEFKFEKIKVGHAQDVEAGTGITVLLAEEGLPAGINVGGGGPASREIQLLSPLSAADRIQAVVLGGGSAFGLIAANGVMNYLVERGFGFETAYRKIPLVVQSDLYDLGVGMAEAYPTPEMAYLACENAQKNYQEGLAPEQGNVGAGTGATVGKFYGEKRMMKSGLGTYAAQVDSLKMACIIAVNAFGDVKDPSNGKLLAGLLNPEKDAVISTEKEMFAGDSTRKEPFSAKNTTIGCLITNGKFSKLELNKIAQMAQDGMARAIAPVHTTADGDTLYVLSEDEVEADLNLAGALAAYVTSQAIMNAVKSAEPLYGLETYQTLQNLVKDKK